MIVVSPSVFRGASSFLWGFNLHFSDAEFLAKWELIAFDERGYPDYMEYDWLEARVVQSWWNIRLKKKGDKDAEEVVVRMLRMDDFNAEGKITSSDLYYNAALLAD